MLIFNLGIRIAAAVFNVPPEALSPLLPMMEPVPKSLEEVAHRHAVSEALATGWSSVDGYAVSSTEESYVNSAMYLGEELSEEESRYCSPGPSTYGEITELGARQLFSYMGLGNHNNANSADGNSDIVFFDLGSGAGKLVAQVYMELPFVRRAVGIELAPSRHAAAISALKKLGDEATNVRALGFGCKGDFTAFENEAESLEFLEGDMFEVDISEATHVYVASLCFTGDMMKKLGEKFVKEAPKLKCVASLKPFSSESRLFEKKFGKGKVEYVEMSWTKPRGEGCSVYFYGQG